MLPENRTKRQKNIHRMPERCRIFVPVYKGMRGNKKSQYVMYSFLKGLPGVGSKPGSSRFNLFSHYHHFTV
jgi:hypothetical protein